MINENGNIFEIQSAHNGSVHNFLHNHSTLYVQLHLNIEKKEWESTIFNEDQPIMSFHSTLLNYIEKQTDDYLKSLKSGYPQFFIKDQVRDSLIIFAERMLPSSNIRADGNIFHGTEVRISSNRITEDLENKLKGEFGGSIIKVYSHGRVSLKTSDLQESIRLVEYLKKEIGANHIWNVEPASVRSQVSVPVQK